MQQVAAAIVVGAVSVSLAAPPPPTAERPVTDTVHGQTFVDPFRWLEGDNSDPANMGKMTDEVAGWTDAQNAYTRSILDNLPGRAQLEARLRELMQVGSVSAPSMRGNRYFYTRREGSQAQAVLYMREGHDGQDRELLDPAKVDPSGLTTLAWASPSPSGKLLAFGMYRSGDENSVLYLMDIDTGTWLADEIPGKVGLDEWLPDSSGFFYSNLENLDDPYSGQTKFHVIGTNHRQDKVLFRQRDVATFFYGDKNLSAERLSVLASTWGPFAAFDRACEWMVVGYWTGTDGADLWAANLDEWRATGDVKLTEMAYNKPGRVVGFAIRGDTAYLATFQDAPNGRVVAVDLKNPGYDNWKTIVPEDREAVLSGMSMAKDRLVIGYMQNAYDRLAMFDFAGKSLGDVKLPGIGSAGIAADEDRTEAFITYESFNEPDSIYRIDLAKNQPQLWERPEVPVDPSIAEVKQVWYSSKDGTRVPMFLVHKKGLSLNGDNPTLLYGYGGFNISQTPFFSPNLFPWIEAGGVYAIANLRGGGEFGSEWHRSGMLENKQNVFDDFISAAEHLIEAGYTNPQRLAIAGGSNGGLLTGAVAVQRPDLFKAVVCSVPLLDMLRYQDFLMARYWVPEYGSAEDPAQFEYIRKYSPYQNIREGVEYPAMYITAGENDARVHPMHARKMAARLQAATTSDPDEKPIMLWVDRDAGHGAGKPLELRIRDAADSRMFLMWQLGMLERP